MHQTRQEEVWNAVSHGIGVLLGIIALVLMVVLAAEHHHPMAVVSCAIYGTTLIILYLASTLYHALRKPELKKLFKVIDHSSIYLLIAGTYTPFTLVTLEGPWGWALFGIIWGLTAIGLIFKFFFTGRFEFISVVLYLSMGWLIVIAIKPLIEALPFAGLMWMLAGGLCYTGGVAFYVVDDKYHFTHFLWHLCVLAGSVCQFIAVLGYVVLTPAS
jgi:hemolysin III